MKTIQNLLRNRARTILTVFSIALATATMITLLAIGNGFKQSVSEVVRASGADIYVLSGAHYLGPNEFGAKPTILNASFLSSKLNEFPGVVAISPVIENRPVYLKVQGKADRLSANASIPSKSQLLDSKELEVTKGGFSDPTDPGWEKHSLEQIYSQLDSFHTDALEKPSATPYSEWHYFNAIDDYQDIHLFVSYSVGSTSEPGRSVGFATLFLKLPDKDQPIAILTMFPKQELSYSSDSPNLKMGNNSVQLVKKGLRLKLSNARTPNSTSFVDVPEPVSLDLYFRGMSQPLVTTDSYRIKGEEVIGHVAPMCRAEVTGTIKYGQAVYNLQKVRGYHDHNWGRWSWKNVNWIWGQASEAKWTSNGDKLGRHSIVFARIEPSGYSASATREIKGRLVLFDGWNPTTSLHFRGSDVHNLSWKGKEALKESPLAIELDAYGYKSHLKIKFMSTAIQVIPIPTFPSTDVAEWKGVYQVSGIVNGERVDFMTTGFWEYVNNRSSSE